MKSEKKILVFGVFDKLHEGHREFLKQAKALGGELYIIVAKDEMVQSLKQKSPTHTLIQRIELLKSEKLGDYILESDASPHEWKVITEIKPDIVALGYDQTLLEQALREKIRDFPFQFEIVKLKPHEPHIFHTSLLE